MNVIIDPWLKNEFQWFLENWTLNGWLVDDTWKGLADKLNSSMAAEKLEEAFIKELINLTIASSYDSWGYAMTHGIKKPKPNQLWNSEAAERIAKVHQFLKTSL